MTPQFWSGIMPASLALPLLLFSLTACDAIQPSFGSSVASCDVNERVSPSYSGPSERAYCTSTPSYSTPVNITVDADYEKRNVELTGLGAVVTGNPIRYAEVEILDADGNRLQCGELDITGQAILSVPQSSIDTLTVRVNARGYSSSSYNRSSVMNCPEKNDVHYITQDFTPDSSKTVSLSASATTGDMEGAAFNIFDQITEANDFLRTEVGACSWPDCDNFTVAPKVEAYWVKGFNPNVYQNNPSSGISFYIPDERHFFILGGISGDVDSSDTDHFDNSVIIHEYAHFLEDALSESDSPGGAHYGNSVIDARLAWSEGFANFFQAAVLGSPYYRDSFGTPDDTTGLLINVPVEDPNGGCTIGDSTTGCDLPAVDYEGNFREFAVTRTLWDLYDSGGLNTDGDTIDNIFDEIWAVLTTAAGFLNSDQAFRNLGLLLEVQRDDLTGSTDVSSVLSDADHLTGDTQEYSYYMEPDVSGCTDITMLTNSTGSDYVENSDFLFYKHSGGSLTVQMTYTTTDTGPGIETESDVDLYMYNSNAIILSANSIAGYSQDVNDGDSSTSETESFTVSASEGDYLLHIFAYDPEDELTYTVTINGDELCPATRP